MCYLLDIPKNRDHNQWKVKENERFFRFFFNVHWNMHLSFITFCYFHIKSYKIKQINIFISNSWHFYSSSLYIIISAIIEKFVMFSFSRYEADMLECLSISIAKKFISDQMLVDIDKKIGSNNLFFLWSLFIFIY